MTDYNIKLKTSRYVLEISPDSECKLIEGGLVGFDCTGFDVKLNPYAATHGGYVNKRRFAQRELEITFEIAAPPTVANAVRRKIVSMMDPDEDFEIEVSLYGVSRRISAIPYGEARISRPTLSDYTEVSLCFIAPTVFFMDTSPCVIKFMDSVPLLTFPMNLMAGAGTAAGLNRISDSTTAKNMGDGECGITAKIMARGGNVVSPGIKCGDKFIKCPITLKSGDILEIDTRPQMKNIYLNGERFFSFDRDSVFFSIPAGESTMSVICDSGGEFIEAEVEYTPIYFGM